MIKRSSLYTFRWYAKQLLLRAQKTDDKIAMKAARELIEHLSVALGDEIISNATKPKTKLKPIGDCTLGVVVGHTKNSRGAHSDYLNGVREYDYWSEFADILVKYGNSLGVKVVVEKRNDGGIKGAYLRLKKHKPDAFIELHFNSFKSPKATGTEVLYCNHFDEKGLNEIVFASMISKAMADITGLPMRHSATVNGKRVQGLKTIAKKGERGYYNLMQTIKTPSILTEPFFGSNPDDSKAFDDNKNKVAKAMIEAFIAWMNEAKS